MLFGWRHQATVNRAERERTEQSSLGWVEETLTDRHQYSSDNALGRVVLNKAGPLFLRIQHRCCNDITCAVDILPYKTSVCILREI